jgi:hypothetical protein
MTGGKQADANMQTEVEYVSADGRVAAEGTQGRTHTHQERSALGGKEADERSVGHVMHLRPPRQDQDAAAQPSLARSPACPCSPSHLLRSCQWWWVSMGADCSRLTFLLDNS